MAEKSEAAVHSVLITGAAGFVGRHMSKLLAARGWQVTGLDLVLPSPHLPASESPFVDFWRCDLLDEVSLVEFASRRKFSAVVHLAGLLPVGSARRDLFAVNVGATSSMLHYCAGKGCHVVLFSTGAVYGNQAGPFLEGTECLPADPYGQSKFSAEALLRAWGHSTSSPVTILRPSVLYGPGAAKGMLLLSLLAALREGKPFPMTGGEQLRDFLHVDDAISAVAAILDQRAAGTWNVASGESRTVREAAELCAKIAGRPELLRIGALPYRNNEIYDYRPDPTALNDALQWRPQVTLATGLERLWKQMQ